MAVAVKRKETNSKSSGEQLHDPAFRFSGHETFACRFAWLSKAYHFLKSKPELWIDDDQAIVELGIGKNMVRSLRFWAQAYGVVTQSHKIPQITQFGEVMFGSKGLDPYLEHRVTPWILHWKLASNHQMPLFSWFYLFNRWPFPEFTRTDVLKWFRRESERLGFNHSDITLSQHFDVLLHTYLPSRSASALEDSLDGPLVDLGLVKIVGQKRMDGGRAEPVYAFDREKKPAISAPMFEFVLDEFWAARHAKEATLAVREICFGTGSPGRALLLSEEDIHTRLDECSRTKNAPFEYLPSAIAGRIVRRATVNNTALLRKTYEKA